MAYDFNAVDSASEAELNLLIKLSIGRVWGLLSRPFQDGDIEQFEECAAIVKHCGERLGIKIDMPQYFAKYNNTLTH